MNKAGLIQAIQAVADATGNNNFRIALGAPGDNLEDSIGNKKSTGRAWIPEPKSFPIVVEGIARFMGVAREMTEDGMLLETDHRIELTDNDVTVTLPAPEAKFTGSYVVKAMGTTGGVLSGTIDGGAASLPVANWGFVRFYCNGNAWLTG